MSLSLLRTVPGVDVGQHRRVGRPDPVDLLAGVAGEQRNLHVVRGAHHDPPGGARLLPAAQPVQRVTHGSTPSSGMPGSASRTGSTLAPAKPARTRSPIASVTSQTLTF